jgi:hypothetical protein
MSVFCVCVGVCRLYYEGKAGSEANTTQALKVNKQIAQPHDAWFMSIFLDVYMKRLSFCCGEVI